MAVRIVRDRPLTCGLFDQDSDISQTTISFSVIDAVADYEAGADLQASEIDRGMSLADQQRAAPHRCRAASLDSRHHRVEREPGIRNILNHNNMTAAHATLDLLEDLDFAR